MKFFTTLAETGIENVVIEVKKSEGDTITVFITPKSKAKDEALNKLKPIFVTGTPEEIDKEFFAIISEPLKDTQKVFSNIEAYEAQKAEIAKETAEKKDAKSKTAAAKTKAKTDDDLDDDGEEGEEKVVPAKVVKVNNEKVLKDFMTSIKSQDILTHKDKIEQLYGLCSEDELAKPFAKKVRIDLDIAIRKQKNIDDARLKFGFTKPDDTPEAKKEDVEKLVEVLTGEKTVVETETAEIVIAEEKTENVVAIEEESITQEPALTTKESFKQRNAVPKAIPQIADGFPNVIIATVPGPEPAQPIMEEMEVVAEIEEVAEIKIPVVIAPPTPPAPPAPPVIEEVLEFVMISTDGTKEDYMKAGWSEEQMIEHGKAHWVKVQKTVSAPPTSLKYEFPKPFDAPNQQ